ncbi:hypothetical protein SAMN05877809_104378 [Rhodobacter sp. JA431]|nr:hypothetical protein SAMN05877809_104378 [Rhodobacter sp. JA431]
MLNIKMPLVALTIAVVGTGAWAEGTQPLRLAQSSCSSGLNYCAPGSYGPGGCYRLGFATCTAGLVCTDGMSACKPSNGGPAYCYRVGYGNCN